MRAAALSRDPATYRRHALHAEGCAWVEKNCYVDIWIELIHAHGLEPLAVAPFVFAIDLDADQWTFFKPPHGELWDLYGIDVQELNVWRPLLEHALTHLALGRFICTEADAFWLPDTQGTDYRTQHTKSSIIVAEVDVERKRLCYFHNAGYYALEGEDFDRTFRVGAAPDPAFMPLFAELVKVDALRRLPADELAARSRRNLREHLARAPSANPVARFAGRFADEIAALQPAGLPRYHAWAFATIRQLGAAFEVGAAYLRWLGASGERDLEAAAAACDAISSGAKTLILKAARAVNARRAADFGEVLGPMAGAWDTALGTLRRRFGS